MGFVEECIKLERSLKKDNPKARLNWRPLYYQALKYVITPSDYIYLRQMSISDVFEFVRGREKMSRQTAPGLTEDNGGADQAGRNTKPRLAANEWAYQQVRELGRSPADVYPEWKEKMGDRVKQLVDPRDSFSKAIKPKRK